MTAPPRAPGERHGATNHAFVQDVFRVWARSYDTAMWQWTIFRPAYRALLRSVASRAVRPAEVLDLSCGTGEFTRMLAAEATSARVVGLDLSADMVRRARDKGLRVVQGDALALPFGDALFDLVTSCYAMHYYQDLHRAFGEVRRVLRPGGRFAFVNIDAGLLDVGPLRFALARFVTGQRLHLRGTREVEVALTRGGFEIVRRDMLHPFAGVWVAVVRESVP